MHNILSCTVHRIFWKQRGFLRADGTLVIHGKAISALLEDRHLPIILNITKCTVHQKVSSLIAKGNNLGYCDPTTYSASLLIAQVKADPYEKSNLTNLHIRLTKVTQDNLPTLAS